MPPRRLSSPYRTAAAVVPAGDGHRDLMRAQALMLAFAAMTCSVLFAIGVVARDLSTHALLSGIVAALAWRGLAGVRRELARTNREC